MAAPRDIRRVALQALYQLDVLGVPDSPDVVASLKSMQEEDSVRFTDAELDRAYRLACAAYASRRDADDAVRTLAPTWPAHRQPAIDRCILRLAYHELVAGTTGRKIIINEAVELAKKFSTERSPAFINGVLDKVMRSLPPLAADASAGDALAAAQPEPGPAPDDEAAPVS
jgi:N utilization substance protein B